MVFRNKSDYRILESMLQSKRDDKERERIYEAERARQESNNPENEAIRNIRESAIRKKRATSNFNNFKEDVHDFLLEGFLNKILEKCFIKTSVTESQNKLCEALVHDYVTNTGYYNIMNKMKIQNSYLLSEAVALIDRYSEKIIKEADQEVLSIDPDDREEYYKDLDGESIDNIADIIRSRVSQAVEDFLNKNIIDSINTEELLSDTKEKIENINTGDKELNKDIAESYTNLMNRKLKQMDMRPRSIFEQSVYNIYGSVVSNQDILMEYCDQTGQVDMDKLVDKATAIYTFLEMLNTTRIENFTSSNILESIKIQ